MTVAMHEAAASEALLTAKEVAVLFKASESLVYKLQRQGRLPAVRIGWLLRFRPETVRAFMRGGAIPARLAGRLGGGRP
jgi:excisionase family DNA binding protein